MYVYLFNVTRWVYRECCSIKGWSIWNKFRQLPFFWQLNDSCILMTGKVYSSCMRNCMQGSHASWKVMEFKKWIFQAWKVMENDCGYVKSWKSHEIPPIGHGMVLFLQKDNHFRSLTIKLREYWITISKTNVWILAFQFTYLLFYSMFLILVIM